MEPDERARHEAAIRAATDTYRKAKEALADAQYALVEAMKAGFVREGEGLRVSDIARAADHEWTREYVGKKVNPQPKKNAAK